MRKTTGYMHIAKQMRDARIKAGLDRIEAARAMLVAPQTISNWESGKIEIKLSALMSMSHAYKCQFIIETDGKMNCDMYRKDIDLNFPCRWANR